MTDKTKHNVRPARQADLLRFFGRDIPVSVRAHVIEKDGDILAVGGYYIAGSRVAVFSDIADKNLPKLLIWREALKLMKSIKLPAYCIADHGSGPFLRRLGWKFSGSSTDGDIYTWSV